MPPQLARKEARRENMLSTMRYLPISSATLARTRALHKQGVNIEAKHCRDILWTEKDCRTNILLRQNAKLPCITRMFRQSVTPHWRFGTAGKITRGIHQSVCILSQRAGKWDRVATAAFITLQMRGVCLGGRVWNYMATLP